MKMAKSVIALTLVSVLLLSACGTKKDIPTSLSYIVSPVTATPADTMEDAKLIELLEKTLYQNAEDAFDWGMGPSGLKYDSNQKVLDTDGNEMYLVTNVASVADLRANYEVVFSKQLAKKYIYSNYIDVENPMFQDRDGKLYVRPYGVGAQIETDFTKATVVKKSADSFTVEAPIMGDLGGVKTLIQVYSFIVVKQGDYWVLDTFVLFNPVPES